MERTSEQGQAGGGKGVRAAAWFSWVVCATLAAFSLLLPGEGRGGESLWVYLQFVSFAMAFVTVGAVVASRRPENLVGWLLLAIGFEVVLGAFVAGYAEHALLVRSGSLPGGVAAAWLAEWLLVPVFHLLALLLVLFPDGRLPSRRWRPFVWLVVITALAAVFARAFSPGPLEGFPSVPNPLGIEALGGLLPVVERTWEVVGLILVVVFATASLFVRMRRASGVERQQVKWLLYAATLLSFAGLLGLIIEPIGTGWVGLVILTLGFLSVPVAIGIAILRYRLYEIDIIINRTLVYGTLTGTLALVYFGGVTLTQASFRTLTDQQELPQLVIVASTLVIAALFTPLRRRIQSIIDRSFYRRKYDAARTLEGFSKKLRDETDLEALRGDLVGVVRETMQPAHVSVWLQHSAPQKSKEVD
jgi:hypothetical protein